MGKGDGGSDGGQGAAGTRGQGGEGQGITLSSFDMSPAKIRAGRGGKGCWAGGGGGGMVIEGVTSPESWPGWLGDGEGFGAGGGGSGRDCAKTFGKISPEWDFPWSSGKPGVVILVVDQIY